MKWKSSITIRLMALLMALCPFTLSVLFHTEGRSVPLAIAAPQLPAVAFHQYAVDLRTIHPTTEAHGTFVFQNKGREAVRITGLEPSCGCLTPVLQGDRDRMIAAGEHGRVIVRMQPANTSAGPHKYTVKVKYFDPEPRESLLTLKMVIPVTTLTVSPPSLIVYHPAGSEPTVKDFTITDGRGKRFEITGVSVDTPLLEWAIGEAGRTATGNFQQSVRVSIAGELPPTRTDVLLRIATDDPDVPELRVPLRLQGPVNTAAVESDSALDHQHSLHPQQ
jgi:hypothetical protein